MSFGDRARDSSMQRDHLETRLEQDSLKCDGHRWERHMIQDSPSVKMYLERFPLQPHQVLVNILLLIHLIKCTGISLGLTEDGKHILGMAGVPLSPSLIGQRINKSRAMISLVERNSDQSLGRRLALAIPVANGGRCDAGHALLRR